MTPTKIPVCTDWDFFVVGPDRYFCGDCCLWRNLRDKTEQGWADRNEVEVTEVRGVEMRESAVGGGTVVCVATE